MSHFNAASLNFSGFPQANEEFQINSQAFVFTLGEDLANNHIRMDDISTVSELASRTAQVINGNDAHVAASASGSSITLSPDPGMQPGSILVTSSASNLIVSLSDPDVNGVYVNV